MNSQGEDTQNDGTIKGQNDRADRDDRADERIENFGEESADMDDRNEDVAADRGEAGRAAANSDEMRGEGPDLTGLFEQVIRLMRRESFSAAAAGDFGDRHQAIREQVDAVIEGALSDEELGSLTESLGKFVDALGGREEDMDGEWPDPGEFAARRGSGHKQGFARARGAVPSRERDFEPGLGGGFGHGFGPGFGRGFGRGHGRGSDQHGFDLHGFDQRDGWGRRQDWSPRSDWDPRDERDESPVDEGRFDRQRGHGRCGADGNSPDHLGRDHRGPDHRGPDRRGHDHRANGRRRGMGKMVGAAFEHGFAAGYQRG